MSSGAVTSASDELGCVSAVGKGGNFSVPASNSQKLAHMPLLEPRKRTRRNLVPGASTVGETSRRTCLFLARLTIVYHLVPSAELWTW